MPNEYYRPATRLEEDDFHNGWGNGDRYIDTYNGVMVRISQVKAKGE